MACNALSADSDYTALCSSIASDSSLSREFRSVGVSVNACLANTSNSAAISRAQITWLGGPSLQHHPTKSNYWLITPPLPLRIRGGCRGNVKTDVRKGCWRATSAMFKDVWNFLTNASLLRSPLPCDATQSLSHASSVLSTRACGAARSSLMVCSANE